MGKRKGLTQRGFCLKQEGGCLGPFSERGRSILRVGNKGSMLDIGGRLEKNSHILLH